MVSRGLNPSCLLHYTPCYCLLLALYSWNSQLKSVPEMSLSPQCQGGGVEGAATGGLVGVGIRVGTTGKDSWNGEIPNWEGEKGELTFGHAVGNGFQ